MTNANETTIQNFQHLMETYGSDRTRWPAAVRANAEALLATDAQAREMLAEAVALDRLLDQAPTVSIDRERALAQRILTAAGVHTQAIGTVANVVAFRVPAARLPVVVHRAAAAALAASLLLGFVVGTSGAGTSAIAWVSEAAGSIDDEPELTALMDHVPGSEDVL